MVALVIGLYLKCLCSKLVHSSVATVVYIFIMSCLFIMSLVSNCKLVPFECFNLS